MPKDFPERIWLVPEFGDDEATVWCDAPAPSAGMDPAEAPDYVRADVHDLRVTELLAANAREVERRRKAEAELAALKAPIPRKEATWGWWASRDEERYTVGPESSRGAVIKAAMTDFYGEPFFIVEATQGHISFNVFHHVIDWIDEDNCEAVDPEGDPWSVAAGVTPSQERDLHYRLAETAARWAHDHGLSVSAWRFSETRNAERIDPTTLEAAGITSTTAASSEPQPSDSAPSSPAPHVMQTDGGS